MANTDPIEVAEGSATHKRKSARSSPPLPPAKVKKEEEEVGAAPPKHPIPVSVPSQILSSLLLQGCQKPLARADAVKPQFLLSHEIKSNLPSQPLAAVSSNNLRFLVKVINCKASSMLFMPGGLRSLINLGEVWCCTISQSFLRGCDHQPSHKHHYANRPF